MIHAIEPVIDPTPSLLPSLRRIADIARLQPNWDGEGGDPPAAEAVAAAYLLIEASAERRERLDLNVIPPLTSSPIPVGELLIEWRGPTSRIDVQASPDGSYGYAIKWGAGEEARYDEAGDTPLETLLTLIDRVLGA